LSSALSENSSQLHQTTSDEKPGGEKMPDILKKYWQQVSEFWQSLDKSQKKRLYITSAIVAVAIGVCIFMLARPHRITLVRSDDTRQISQMVNVLNENKIWNTLDETGTGIIINEKDKNKARIALSSNGLPKEGTTFADAISMIGIGTTESDKEQIWRQQKISEIASNIKMLDNIYDATVNLAVPERSVFLIDNEDAPEPQAIVTVKSKTKLTPEQVRGIELIVARSVENLDVDNISIVDGNTGLPLNDDSRDDLIGAAATQEELRIAREKEIRRKVLEQLGNSSDAFDSITVTANVILDFDKEASTIKSVTNPAGMTGGALISGERTSETVNNGSAAGAAGLDSNPGTSYETGDNNNSNYVKNSEIYNYAYDEKLVNQEKATGKFIPEKSGLAISLWYGNKVKDDSKLTEDFMEGIRESASMATGIPVENISINKLKLAPKEAETTTPMEKIKEILSDYGLFLILLILTISLVIISLPKRRNETPLEEALVLETGDEQLIDTQEIYTPITGMSEPLPELDLEGHSEVKKQIDRFIKQKPEEVAQLLRNWLTNNRDN